MNSLNVLLAASLDAVGTSRLPKLLNRAGFNVTLLAPRGNVTHHSRYVAIHVFTGEGAPGVVAAELRRHLETKPDGYDWVILSDEPVLWAAAELSNRAWLTKWFPVPFDPMVVELLTSKIKFLLASRALGLPTPLFATCRNGPDVIRVASDIGYPVFIKAEQGLAGSGLRFATSLEDLRSQLSVFPANAELLVQQNIAGRSGSISVLFDHGRPVCWFGYLMTETWPNRFSAACKIEIFDHPDIALLATGIGQMTGFNGFAGIDWVHNPRDNRLSLLEFNPRPTPVFYQGPMAGIDFSAALRDVWSGNKKPQMPRLSGGCALLFPQNLFRSIDDHRPVTFLRTLGDASWDDPRLTLAHIRRVATHYLPKSWKDTLKRSHLRFSKTGPSTLAS